LNWFNFCLEHVPAANDEFPTAATVPKQSTTANDEPKNVYAAATTTAALLIVSGYCNLFSVNKRLDSEAGTGCFVGRRLSLIAAILWDNTDRRPVYQFVVRWRHQVKNKYACRFAAGHNLHVSRQCGPKTKKSNSKRAEPNACFP
jgi:hypothetical protein